ncbi:MAG: hypothetical protein A2X29_06490 [Elusimicrobia bacterium GWA2_64_40]|nr:MAG: hypothetical protein A2X29_06490 [Elusimicrobia bacterium GWA2_64_40]HAN04996.1 insulinase family protein [Elusimicrobiota bacterium]
MSTPTPYPPVAARRLSNGLQVLVLEKKFVPTVSFALVFKAGNVDNAPGKTGLAHLFEHMAFKGTTSLNSAGYAAEKPALDRVEAAGQALIAEESSAKPDPAAVERLRAALEEAEAAADAFIVEDEYWKLYSTLGESGLNAMTSADYTAYVVSLPAARLEAWMVIEADRFKNPVLREFYRERSVVMEERRMGESEPGRVLWEALLARAFTAHPYRNPTIGWMEDIRRLSRTDAEEFYRTYYVPNNATLAVVGDVEPERVFALAERHFSGWQARPLPSRERPVEPPQTGERRAEVIFKAQPSLRLGFHNPGPDHPDFYALMMACEVLSSGKTGRFYANLVEGRQLALHASAYASFPGSRYPSLTVISAAPKAPRTTEELDAALMAEIDRLKAEPPAAWEMEKILNNYDAEMVKQLESNSGMAMSLAQNEQLLGDWRYDWRTGERLRAVTPAQVSAAAAKYFSRDNRTAVFLKEPAV